MNERNELRVMGVLLGTYDDWDQGDTDVLQFLHFEPLPATGMIAGILTVYYTTGVLEVYSYDNAPPTTREYQFREVLRNLEDATCG